jgi:hypothetical protein
MHLYVRSAYGHQVRCWITVVIFNLFVQAAVISTKHKVLPSFVYMSVWFSSTVFYAIFNSGW